MVVRGRLHGCARGRRTRGGREYDARFAVAALLQFCVEIVRRGGRKRCDAGTMERCHG